jgi:putative Ig domain-containing protein
VALISRGLTVLIGTAAAAAALTTSALATPALTSTALATPAHPPTTVGKHSSQRVCAQSTHPGTVGCFALRRTDVTEPAAFSAHAITPNATPSGYGPSDLRSAYALTASGSATETVAIVDAYDDPNAESDLGVYRSQYGLPACTTANGCFKKVNQNGSTSSLPAANSSWAGEISLDIDMVSAICPNCHILLVEASSASMTNLGTAVNTAVNQGAKFVSNSYGGPEDSTVTSADNSYFNHPGVAITASSGDSDYDGGSYPATGAHVTAVGGTSLVHAANARGWNETVWNTTSYSEGAGSGCSAYIAKPSFQSGVSTSCSRRAEADVSAVADPATGVSVYQTYGGSGWAVYGGTSAASPIIASVYALAGVPGSTDSPNAYPYSHTGNLNDVTSGSNGTCGAPICTARAGWDGPTGLGTPNGTAAFSASGGGASGVTVTNPGNKTGTVGTAISSFTLTASGGTGSYSWSATGLPPGLTIGASTGTVSGTPTTAGTYTVVATATSGTASGSTTFTFTVSAGGGGGCSTGQKLGNPGFESGNTVWAASSGVIGQNSSYGEPAHTGTWDAYLDGYGTTHTDTVTQSVTIPAGCTSSTLSFWLHVDTSETTTSTAYDKLTVKIGSTTLATYSNLNKASGYVQHSFSVGSFAGQTVTVSFSGSEDSSLQTSFVVDDTAVNAA